MRERRRCRWGRLWGGGGGRGGAGGGCSVALLLIDADLELIDSTLVTGGGGAGGLSIGSMLDAMISVTREPAFTLGDGGARGAAPDGGDAVAVGARLERYEL